MNNEILQEKEHTKYLGVILDNKLTWKNHIPQTNFRISKGVGILYKRRQCVSRSTLRSLYFAFVQWNVNCCLLNWGNAAPSNLTPIRTNLNKALRIMCYKGPMYHSNTLYKKRNVLPLEGIHKLQLAKFMWKLQHKRLPQHTRSKYTTIPHKYNTRQSTYSKLHLPSVRLDCAKRFTIYNGAHLWISHVPTCVKSERTMKQFT